MVGCSGDTAVRAATALLRCILNTGAEVEQNPGKWIGVVDNMRALSLEGYFEGTAGTLRSPVGADDAV